MVRCCAVVIPAGYLFLLHSVVLSLVIRVNVLVSLDYCLARLAIDLLWQSSILSTEMFGPASVLRCPKALQ